MIGSFVAHVGLLLTAGLSVPALGPTDDSMDPELHFRTLFPVEVDGADMPALSSVPKTVGDSDVDREGAGESRCCDDMSMGSPLSHERDGRYAVAGPADNPDPHLARVAGPGFPWSGWGPPWVSWGADPHAPIAAWGRDDALGTDPKSANGAMWGDKTASSLGLNGFAGVGSREREVEQPPSERRRVTVMVERHRHRGYQQDALRGWD
jgi:hypothetical protein